MPTVPDARGSHRTEKLQEVCSKTILLTSGIDVLRRRQFA